MNTDGSSNLSIRGQRSTDYFTGRPLGEIVQALYGIEPSTIQQALEIQRKTGSKLGDILVEQGHISEEQLAAYAQQLQLLKNTVVRDGKKVTVTILPDGTTHEEESTASSSSNFSYVRSTGAGGSSTQINIQGSLGEALTHLLVPTRCAGPVTASVPSLTDRAPRSSS